MEQAEFIEVQRPKRKVGPYTVKYRLQTFTVQETDPSKWTSGSPSRSAEDAYRLAEAIYRELDADKEHFIVLMLNNKNRLSGFKVISTGSLTASLVHPREVYSAVLELRAAAIILMHNHPSGDITTHGNSKGRRIEAMNSPDQAERDFRNQQEGEKR